MEGFPQLTKKLVNKRNANGKGNKSANTDAHRRHILSNWPIQFKNRNNK